MPLLLIRDDITRVRCDAIVNAANSSLLGGGGVDGAIHKAAGPGLLRECSRLGGCRTGDAKLTKGYKLPCKYVIHTVGPVWEGGKSGEEELLRSCYRSSLTLAASKKCRSVAFPLISSGVYGYPADLALKTAVDEISAFLMAPDNTDLTVYLVIFSRAAFDIGRERYGSIESFIDDNYSEPFVLKERRSGRMNRLHSLPSLYSSLSEDVAEDNVEEYSEDHFAGHYEKQSSDKYSVEGCSAGAKYEMGPPRDFEEHPFFKRDRKLSGTAYEQNTAQAPQSKRDRTIQEALNKIDESFSEMLLRKIDEKGMSDSECYKKANIDRKLFSKIRSDRAYRPSKNTAIAFAIALELPLPEAKDMLMKAGYALSHSSKFDIIIEYFISSGNYNIFEINEALFAFDQSLLGF